jgi:hypothetical protein
LFYAATGQAPKGIFALCVLDHEHFEIALYDALGTAHFGRVDCACSIAVQGDEHMACVGGI